MRGMTIEPEVWSCCTRIQQEALSSSMSVRSQWNFTFTRPCLSVWIVSSGEPGGATTRAVCGPSIIGTGVRRGVRYFTSAGSSVACSAKPESPFFFSDSPRAPS